MALSNGAQISRIKVPQKGCLCRQSGVLRWTRIVRVASSNYTSCKEQLNVRSCNDIVAFEVGAVSGAEENLRGQSEIRS